MSEQVQLPSVPTEHELAREFPTRPNWQRLEYVIKDETGVKLYADKDFGPSNLAVIQDYDASVRDYLKVYDRNDGAYWDTPFGAVEKAGEAFAAVRLREEQRGKQFRANALRIMGEYKQADDEAIAAKQREIAEQQQKDSDIPPSVSPAQARAALGTPAMPAGIVTNKRPIYDRLITDKRKFIAWLAAHPAYIDVIAMSFSFTNIKHSPVEIDGVTMSLKTTVQNRGR